MINSVALAQIEQRFFYLMALTTTRCFSPINFFEKTVTQFVEKETMSTLF